MTVAELIRLSFSKRYPLSVYLEMRRGMWRITKRTLFRHVKLSSSKQRPRISISQLRSAFDQLAIEKTDSVFIHSGIGNIGVIEGGRRAVFEILTDYIHPEQGNILFPTYPFFPSVYDYLETNPVFDVASAPSHMGSLTQYSLKTGMGTRSIHPSHSVLAIGKDAKIFTSDHHTCTTPFSSNSPFQRFLHIDNPKVILIGVSTDSITLAHAVEDMMADTFPIPLYLDKIYSIRCIGWNKQPISVQTKSHTPVLSLARDVRRFDPLFRMTGAIRKEIPIGLSKITLIDALKFCETLTALGHQGKTIYGTKRLSKSHCTS